MIVDLANTHGYASSGESFSSPTRAGVDHGAHRQGIQGRRQRAERPQRDVWVARRIPDGYVSAHANQARITTFPKDDPENCLYAPDVVEFAREMGYLKGTDEEFSFADAYCPADFGTVRGCDARVRAFFRTVADGMDAYGDYAMGYNLQNRMPLWVKPRTNLPKVLFATVCATTRGYADGHDHGPQGRRPQLPYRWRPMEFGSAARPTTSAPRPRSRPDSGSWDRPTPISRRHGNPLFRGRRRRNVVPGAASSARRRRS